MPRFLLIVLTLFCFASAGHAQESTFETIENPSNSNNTYTFTYDSTVGNPHVVKILRGEKALTETSNPTTKDEYRLAVTGARVTVTFGAPQQGGTTLTVVSQRNGGSTPNPTDESWSKQ